MQIWRIAVERWQFTLVMFMMLAMLGLAALQSIPRTEDPNFDFPITSVIVLLPGADPVDMERLVADPIEDRLAELDDVSEIKSTSRDGLAVISVEFTWGEDPDDKYSEVVREINALRPELPEGIVRLEFKRTNPSLVNIIQIALTHDDDVSALKLKQTAEDLEELLETVPGIRRAETWGYAKPEVRVALNLPRMTELGINLNQVIATVADGGITIPGGAIDLGDRRYNLKTTGDYDDIAEIGEGVITAIDGTLIKVQDIADISWQASEHRYLGRYNGKPAAFVTANMSDNRDIFKIQQGLDAKIDEFKTSLPDGIELHVGFVQAENVKNRLALLGRDFLIALALVSITLLPLGLRAAGIVMITIPLCLAMGVAALWALGYTLNQMTIAGFVVSLGLLVDDAIVVVENIARYLRQGYDRTRAAIAATSQIALAVIGCTAALLFAFLPLLNLPEAAGEFTRGLPLAVTLTVLASLVVALTIVPFLASRLLPREESEDGNRVLQAVQKGIKVVYAPVVRAALDWPKTTLVAGLAIAFSSLLLLPVVGFKLFPAADKPQFLINISAPEGASLEATEHALIFVENELDKHPEVIHKMSNLGRGNPEVYYNVRNREENTSTAEIFVGLTKWDSSSDGLLGELRAVFDEYAGARIVVERFLNGPPIAAPVELLIYGPEIETLRDLSVKAEAIMRSTPGMRDIINPMRIPRIDLDLGIDRDKAAHVGVPLDVVDDSVRLAIAGYPAATYRDSYGDEYDIVLRLPMGTSQTLDALEDVRFNNVQGGSIPLSQIASPYLVSGPDKIERRDRERMVSIRAWVESGFLPNRVTEDLINQLGELDIPRGYRIETGGESEAARDALGGLGAIIIVALLGIMAVLVLEFGSFRSTLIVAGVIPFGLLGALSALYVTGLALSYIAVIGLVALVGVEIKNSILLVDFTNQLREEGMELNEAIEMAGEMRFLPVLLTSVTAIGGLTPLAMATEALYAPLAIVMIGGLISSTLLARVVTPVMYKLLPPEIDVKHDRLVVADR